MKVENERTYYGGRKKEKKKKKNIQTTFSVWLWQASIVNAIVSREKPTHFS